MQVKLPRFDNTACKNLTVCGTICSGEEGFLKELAKKRTMVARYRTNSGTAYVRVLTPGRSGKGLHVDCALRDFFPKKKAPTVTHKKAEVIQFLNKAVGTTIDVGIGGAYVLGIHELPERGLIRSLAVGEETGGMKIRLTGGTFSITGAPIKTIRWWSIEKGKRVMVHLEARRTVKIDETYLQDALDWVNGQEGIFLLGKADNGKT